MLPANLIKQPFRVSTNNTTCVHVHIGDGENGFNPETDQRVMRFMYVFDERLPPTHPPRRYNHEYSQNIRAPYRRSELWGSRFEASTQIFNIPSIELLESALRGHHPAFNIKNICNGGSRNKKTIGFRQHAGTFEKQRTQFLIQTVCSIVERCRKENGNQYYDRVWAYAEQEDDGNFHFTPSSMKLFRDIGLQRSEDIYEARLAQSDGAEPGGEKVEGYIPFSLGPSIYDSSDSSSYSNNTAAWVWSLGEEIINP